MKKKLIKITGISLFLLLVFILATAAYLRQRGSAQDKEITSESGSKLYVCSMHPQVIRDAPGDCPICGMFLIEKIDRDKNSFDSTLTDIVRPVNKAVLAAVTTVSPEEAALPLIIEASGIANYDPRKIQTISARFGGLIEKSFVKYQFQHINKGQKIYEVYAPDIYTQRWNYVKLIQAYPDRDDLTKEALEWLYLQGLSKGQIDSLKRSTTRPDYHLAVYSPGEGYAVSRDFDPESFFSTGFKEGNNPENTLAGKGSIGLNDGVAIEKGDPLFKLIDVRSLRVDLKVKTGDGTLLRRGQHVVITDAANPGKHFKGTISQIEPLNGGLFQSVKVFITDNERLLLPGRQIKAQIMAGPREGLWVPATAVVDLGQRRSVFVLEDNKFIATGVRTGVRSGDKVEILSGLARDAKIAGKALLLIDSDGFISIN